MNDLSCDRARRRELSHRASDGLEVWLQWDPHRDDVFVVVHDAATHAVFELCVHDRAAALDAFYDPFTQAAGRLL